MAISEILNKYVQEAVSDLGSVEREVHFSVKNMEQRLSGMKALAKDLQRAIKGKDKDIDANMKSLVADITKIGNTLKDIKTLSKGK